MATTSTDLIEYMTLAGEAIRGQQLRAQRELEIAQMTNRLEDAQAWHGYILALNWVAGMLISRDVTAGPPGPE